MWLTDAQKIGVALVTLGLFFEFLGVMLLLDSALLALGNIMFLSGFPLIIGFQKTYSFFARREKIRGTVAFFLGIILVFVKRPLFGVLFEAVGFLALFGSFFPIALSFMRQLPLIGTFLNLPGISQVADRVAGVRRSAV